jgi:3-phenylpropionate/cinnamic acid dioxygenase small subunit
MADPDPVRDELEIRNVVAQLALLADGGELEDYVQLFTEDAHWDMPGGPRRGHEQIRQGGLDRRAAGAAGPGSASRHLVSTTAVRVRGDCAVAESYWQFFTQTLTSPTLQAMGHYRDTLVRTVVGWRVSCREITVG